MPQIARIRRAVVLVVVAAGVALAGCDRPHQNSAPSAAAPQRAAATAPTVASLVPAATDLLLGMGAGDHLVAVSNYDDTSRQELRGLPKVGDYQAIDWERLHQLRPDVMIIFQSPDRVPAGLKQKADELGVKLVNVRTETLADVYAETGKLGGIVNEPGKAEAAVARTRARLEAVRQRTAGLPKVRTLMAREAGGSGVVGRENFLNELLEIAGGENVITARGWPDIDAETLVSLKPDAVLQLLSGEPEPVVADVRGFWKSQGRLPAVQNGRVYILNAWYSQQPGSHVADIAERMAAALHPEERR